jgi:hypothetical protein
MNLWGASALVVSQEAHLSARRQVKLSAARGADHSETPPAWSASRGRPVV